MGVSGCGGDMKHQIVDANPQNTNAKQILTGRVARTDIRLVVASLILVEFDILDK